VVRGVPITDERGDVFAGMTTAQNITERKEREDELVRQREQLSALNDINQVVQEITEAVIEQSTREQIEQTVCERLAAADSYRFAWIGDVEPNSRTVDPRASAGTDGYLDDVTISVNPDDEHSEGPTGRALRTGKMQTSQDVQHDAEYAPWRDVAETYDFHSSAAIPITHQGTVFGVLNVYADRPHAFKGRERAVIGQLGEIVGHAIAAVERKRALMSDEVVELRFHIPALFEALDTDTTADGRFTIEETVPITDAEYLVYGHATQNAVENLEAIVDAVDHWKDVRFRDTGGDGVAFEARLSSPRCCRCWPRWAAPSRSSSSRTATSRCRCIWRRARTPGRSLTSSATPTPRPRWWRGARPRARGQAPNSSTTCSRSHSPTGSGRRSGRPTTPASSSGPREASGEDVAASLDVAAPTFHQHLRKAEQQIFESLLSSSV